MAISEEIKNKIQENLNNKLREKGKSLVCPVCENNNFILAERQKNEVVKTKFYKFLYFSMV